MVIRAIRVVPASVAVEACSVVVDAAALFCASPVAAVPALLLLPHPVSIAVVMHNAQATDNTFFIL